MWKNIVQPDRPQMTIWRMRIACWIPKATNTHSEYLILIAFPLQQWLHERASVSCSMYITCLVDSWCKDIVESATLTKQQRGCFMTTGNVKAKIDAVECGHGPKKRGLGCAQLQDRVVNSQVTWASMINSMDEHIILSDNYRLSSPAAISSLMGGRVRWLHE